MRRRYRQANTLFSAKGWHGYHSNRLNELILDMYSMRPKKVPLWPEIDHLWSKQWSERFFSAIREMHMIYIPFGWKFSSEFNGVHLEVIRGHLTGSKKVIWGRKSEIRPNAQDMHTIRLEIFPWIQWCASRGHPRSSNGVKKGHLGSKIGNTAKCTWYAYHSTGIFSLNSIISISRSSEVN